MVKKKLLSLVHNNEVEKNKTKTNRKAKEISNN